MNGHVIFSPRHHPTLSTIFFPTFFKTSSLHPQPLIRFKSLGSSLTSLKLSKVRVSKSPNSIFPADSRLSDAGEEDYEEEDEDDDEDIAADEYDVMSGEVSDGGVFGDEESQMFEAEMTRHDGFKWQRVEKLCNEVREFGEEIIDVDELASVYDFRIDKFQVLQGSFSFSSFDFSSNFMS